MMDEAKVNAAIPGLEGSYVTKAERAEIAVRFGESVARLVDEVYDDAMNSPDDWGPAATSMETGLDAMHTRLRASYPWLDDAAHTKLSFMFMMTWK